MKNGRKRRLLIWCQHWLAMLTAACISILIVGSSVQVSMMKSTTSYLVTPWNVDSSNYEESYIFRDILSSNIADAARIAVIRSQMETKGVYDPEKVIDVTAYVNRAGSLPEQYVTARYYLEDLLKWKKFGFERNYVIVDENTFYADVPTYAESEQVLAEESAVTADMTELYETEPSNVYLEVLTCRYLTVDGKEIQELVSNQAEYEQLCKNIEQAAAELYYNYEEYLDEADYFDQSHSNFRYCIRMIVDGEPVYLSNVKIKGLKDSNITEQFEKNGRYLYYYPAEMTYETNTWIEESCVQQVLHTYEYAYPEETKVWMAVDTSYPVSDAYTQALETYHKVLPVWWYLVGTAVAAAVLYVALLIYLTLRQIKEQGCGKESLRLVDRVPTEVFLLLEAVGMAAVVYSARYALQLQQELRIGSSEIIWSSVLLSGAGSFLLLSLFYSIVRRSKAGELWRNSVLHFLCKGIGKAGGRFLRWTGHLLLLFFDHSPAIMRTLFPCVFTFFVNFMGIYFFMKSSRNDVQMSAILGLFLIDGLMVYYVIRTNMDREKIIGGIQRICDGELQYQIDTRDMHGGNLKLATAVNHIGEGIRSAVETSIKDERLKADLITNVSHDLKTPLTSIINYVNLIKREQIDNEKIQGYVEILDQKSQRLKTLTEDLVEASKVSSGNINLICGKINLVELLNQTIGEFAEKFEEKGLQVVATFEQSGLYIWADSRRIWRVVENLFNNIYKYAMPNTRVYVDINVLHGEGTGQEKVEVLVKNISAQPLNIDADQLTERFIRGDVSRSTEGSGLGLSIAKDLTKLQGGDFQIYLDGDLFKVMLTFPLWTPETAEQKEV